MDRSTNNQLNIGLVGCGSISSAHMKSWRDISGVTLKAVSDVNLEAAKKGAEKFNCSFYTDYKQMIKNESIDIVDICTPSGLRKDIAVYAAEHGKHLIVEKPIEINTQRIDEILRAADKNNVTVHGIFGKRFKDVYEWLEGMLKEKRFGKLIFTDVIMKWYRPPEYYKNTWRGTWALDGGGALMNQCIHYVDLVQWLFGMPKSVFAYTDNLIHKDIEAEDTTAALLRFKNGGMGMIQAATSMYPGYSARFSIHGELGGIILQDDSIKRFEVADERPEDKKAVEQFSANRGKVANVSTNKVSNHQLHMKQLAHIIDSIRKGEDSKVSGYEARKAVKLINMVYKSAETRQEIFDE